MATPRQVAEWMVERLSQEELLYQEVAVFGIQKEFGDEFIYYNQNGNLAISREVLAEFKELTKKTVVWERGQRLWRVRRDFDPRGRSAE